MPLFLLDRDGVVVVNRPTNVKTPDELVLIPGAAEAIARLSAAGSMSPSAPSPRWREAC
jgi:D-glycero-D-manno-heptose 1,7-bisphosphate phosphatase